MNGSAAHHLVWEVVLNGSAACDLQRRSRLRRWGLHRTNHATAGQHRKQCRQQQQQQQGDQEARRNHDQESRQSHPARARAAEEEESEEEDEEELN